MNYAGIHHDIDIGCPSIMTALYKWQNNNKNRKKKVLFCYYHSRSDYINPRLTNGGCCNPPYGFSPVALKR